MKKYCISKFKKVAKPTSYEAKEWKRKAEHYAKILRQLSVYIPEKDIECVDLSKVENPDDIVEKKKLEEKEKEAQKAVKAKNRKILKQSGDDSAVDEIVGLEDGVGVANDVVMGEDSKAYQNMEDIVNNRQPRADDSDDDMDAFDVEKELQRVGEVGKEAENGDESSVNSNLSATTSSTFKDPKNDQLRPPGTKWYATREETEARIRREERMTADELAAEAHEWEECYDPMNEQIYFLHKPSNEIMNKIPRSVVCFRQIEEDKTRNVRNFQEAMHRIEVTNKQKVNRMKLSGNRYRPK